MHYQKSAYTIHFGNSGFLNYARSLNLGTRRSRKFFSFKGSSSSSPHPTSVSASSSLYSIPRQLIAEVCLLSVIMHGLHGLHTLSFTHVALWSSHKFIDTGLFSPGKQPEESAQVHLWTFSEQEPGRLRKCCCFCQDQLNLCQQLVHPYSIHGDFSSCVNFAFC